MNSTNSLPLDQYIPVNYSKGMLAVPTFVESFKQVTTCPFLCIIEPQCGHILISSITGLSICP